MEEFTRFGMLIGKDNLENLSNKHIIVFGIGGVGGYVCEALARSGIGNFTLVDNDIVDVSNLNRQIIATNNSIGLPKVEVMKERILSINKNAKVNTKKCFFLPETAEEFDFSKYDYVVDAIDTVTAKLAIIELAKKNNVPVISAMGTGNKLNPLELTVTDISKTSMCPLARVMRTELRKRGINKLKVVYSKETPIKTGVINPKTGKSVPGSSAFVPGVAGLVIALEVVKDLINI
mgnify:CR=1 FL=1